MSISKTIVWIVITVLACLANMAHSQSGLYLFKPITNPFWCMGSGTWSSSGRLKVSHCTLSDSKYLTTELVPVSNELYVIRLTAYFLNLPDEIRCVEDQLRTGPYVYLLETCSPASQAQQFAVLEVRPGEWLIKNGSRNVCLFLDRLDDSVLGTICNDTDQRQLWIRESLGE